MIRDRSPDTLLPVRLANPFSLRGRLRALAARAPFAACSAYVAGSLRDAGVPAERVSVLHPVPVAASAPRIGRPSAQHLLVVGQLVRGKGVDLAIRALAHLPSTVTLEVVGEGPFREVLERLARVVAPGRVEFRGYVPPEEMTARYDAASVVLVPSRWPEPFGMVGVEAMMRGRPVVGAAHGGIPEWLDERRGVGGLFWPGDVGALAATAMRMLRDADAGERAATWASERFSHARAVDAVEQRLTDLAGRREATAVSIAAFA